MRPAPNRGAAPPGSARPGQYGDPARVKERRRALPPRAVERIVPSASFLSTLLAARTAAMRVLRIQLMRLPVEPKRIHRRVRRRVVKGNGEILAEESLGIDGEAEKAGIVFLVVIQHHIFMG